MKYSFRILTLLFALFLLQVASAQYKMENLDRGVVAFVNGNNVFVSWRMLGTEPMEASYNVYRDGQKVNQNPITNSTNYLDAGGNVNSKYSVSIIVNGNEEAPSGEVATWANFYKEISLNKPANGVTPDNEEYDYAPNDATVADLDGDGQYEIVFKWSPSNAHDNAHDGYTGPTYLEAVKLDGTSMWRINLGINIRSGAHYVEMQVFDFDGDGKAEVAARTADGTIDALGKVIGNATADYRSSVGRVLSGPEYLSIFNGETGAEMSTVNYVPGRGSVSAWGDNYGNRVDRFLSGVAYLDGQNASILMCRGYYTRMVVAAWDFIDGQLQQRWVFDTDNNMNHLKGKGNHQISVADVDNDGKQEVIYGAVVIDDDGSVLNYNTWFHGDALHCGDFDVSNPGLEIFEPTETGSANAADGRPGFVMRDAASGNILWAVYKDGDIGRGNCANIDSRYPGCECWASGGAGLYDQKGNVIGNTPTGCNFSIWWDGDFTRELLDGTKLDEWDETWDGGNGGNSRMFTIYNTATASSINGTKANPNLSADLIGDWREEMIYHSSDNTKLIVFTTNFETNHKLYTLMHDAQYRTAISWQSTGYNQPPHPSFYIGEDMAPAPTPNISLIGANVKDCNGELNGGAFFDDCANCVGGNTNAVACTQDCNGTWAGSAYVDDCATCVGGQTNNVACTALLEAEEVCDILGVKLEFINEGFKGEGYANTDNSVDAYLEFVLNSSTAKTMELNVRYANGSADDRSAYLIVNGSSIGTLSLPSTGGWSMWNTTKISIPFIEGRNTIFIKAQTANGLANIDLFSWSDNALSVANCTLVTATTSSIETGNVFPNPYTLDFKLLLTQPTNYKIISHDGKVHEQGFCPTSCSIGASVHKGIFSLELSNDQTKTVQTIVKQ